jgi:hypothetical protein
LFIDKNNESGGDVNSVVVGVSREREKEKEKAGKKLSIHEGGPGSSSVYRKN